MDNRLKYIQLPGLFWQMATETEIAVKQQNKRCEEIAKKLITIKPKTGDEFERVEAMKEFVLSTHNAGTKTLSLITRIHEMISDIYKDCEILIEGARLRNQLDDAIQSLDLAWKQRDELVNELYVRRGTKGTA